ncbi:hypothetical protein HanPSC8_Chr09g0399311 [Helianthus annuus]|nr:hypothetical protein HanPSC8_Chr09g0399311 [Helianthus annuus]
MRFYLFLGRTEVTNLTLVFSCMKVVFMYAAQLQHNLKPQFKSSMGHESLINHHRTLLRCRQGVIQLSED